MATISTLAFTKGTDGSYTARFTSTGPVTVQMERRKQSLVAVRANVPGMDEVPVCSFQNGYGADVIFNLDVPSGLEVSIKSGTEVLSAKILGND